MKALVVYSSKTGNTKILAEALLQDLPGEKEIHPVETAPDPQGYDLVAVGFWLQAGRPDPGAAGYLARLRGGEKVFLFATHGAAVDSAHAAEAMRFAREELAGKADVLAQFNCQGEVSPVVLEKLSARPEPPAWLAEAPLAINHPDKGDIDRLRKTVKHIISSF